MSEHGRDVLQSRGVAAERIRVVPPGFDGLPDRSRVLTLERDARARPLRGAVDPAQGDTDSGRGLDAARAPRRGARARRGDGCRSRVRSRASGTPSKLRPPNSIVVSGCVDDAALDAAYASADLFVLPSRYEGYGIVYAEALAFGLPVVACDVGPVPRLVGAEAALLVPPGDMEALSEALDRLLEDSALRRRMSAAAVRRAAGLPRWEDTVAGFRCRPGGRP